MPPKNRTIKLLSIGLMSLALLAGCSKTEKKADNTEYKQPEVFPVEENALYFPPDEPTEYIASCYNQLTKDLPADLQKPQAEIQTDETQAKIQTDENGNPIETEEKPEETLNTSQAINETVAQDVAKVFISDFFTLYNKDNSSEIGGLDYIPSAQADSFKEYAKYYYYNNYPIILSKYGQNNLPNVKDVKISNLTQAKVSFMDAEHEGYTMDVDIEYEPSDQASSFKTQCKCTIIKLADVHYVDPSDVTAERDAGSEKEVFRVIAIEDR